MAVYVTSDLHLGHRTVATVHRGFPSVEAHDLAILSGIANTLSAGDRLIVCGDLSSGTHRQEALALKKIAPLTEFFRIDYLLGNHDTPHPRNPDALERLPLFTNVFASVTTAASLRIPGMKGVRLWLSHFPYRGDGDRYSPEDRYPETRLHDNGVDWLLHGHIHTDQHWTADRSLHIGPDAWGLKPVPLDTVYSMIHEREKDSIA